MDSKLFAPETGGTKNGSWNARHNDAVLNPRGLEKPILEGLNAWKEYAKTYRKDKEANIGHDGVLGDAWAQIGDGFRSLLAGDRGRLDGGTLDAFICNTMSAYGVNSNTLELFQDIPGEADDE